MCSSSLELGVWLMVRISSYAADSSDRQPSGASHLSSTQVPSKQPWRPSTPKRQKIAESRYPCRQQYKSPVSAHIHSASRVSDYWRCCSDCDQITIAWDCALMKLNLMSLKPIGPYMVAGIVGGSLSIRQTWCN